MEGHSLTSVGISATQEEMVEVITRKTYFRLVSVVMTILQVVNAGVQGALDEFVNKWVEKEVERLLEGHLGTHADMHRALAAAGQNLRMLINNLVDLVQHFVADSPATVSLV